MDSNDLKPVLEALAQADKDREALRAIRAIVLAALEPAAVVEEIPPPEPAPPEAPRLRPAPRRKKRKTRPGVPKGWMVNRLREVLPEVLLANKEKVLEGPELAKLLRAVSTPLLGVDFRLVASAVTKELKNYALEYKVDVSRVYDEGGRPRLLFALEKGGKPIAPPLWCLRGKPV